MEQCRFQCISADQGFDIAEKRQCPTKFHISALQFPVSCDALADLKLVYPSPLEKTTIHVEIEDPRGATTRLLVNHEEGAIVTVPFFTETEPLIVMDGMSLRFNPAPERVECSGICYPPRIRYRVLSAPHVFHGLQYDPGRLAIIPVSKA